MTDWKAVGAWRKGTISSVALSPNFTIDGIALAATGAGIYRTTDGGTTWQRAINGFTDLSAVTVTFAPGGEQLTAFASAETGRLYRSLNGGERWSEVTTWTGLGLATVIALSPDYRTDRTVFVGTPGGVFRTFDDGESWEEASFGLLDLDILCLRCAPDFAETGILWAGTALGGFYRSRNRGLAWRESGIGLPDAAIQCVAVLADEVTTPVLFVGTESDGVYRSDNQGALWERVGDPLKGMSVNTLAISRSGQDMLLLAGTNAGIYSSPVTIDAWDTTWQLADRGEVLALDFAASSQGTVLAGTFQESLALSSDGGRSWQSQGTNLAAHTPPLLFPTPSGDLYALDTDGALAHSTDDGVTWSPVLVDGDVTAIAALAVAEHAGINLLYAATDIAVISRKLNVEDRPWQTSPLPTSYATHLALAPMDTPMDTAAPAILLANLTGELFVSATGGKSWEPVATAWDGQAVLHLFFSAGAGTEPLAWAVTAQANAAGNYGVILWQSAELSKGWTEVAAFETELPSVLVAQAKTEQNDVLFLATGHRIIKLYTDAAQAELAVQQHFFAEDVRVTALALSPTFTADQTLFAATTGGLFMSTDSGETWSHHADNPTELPIVSLLPKQNLLLSAVTLGGEVWGLN